MISDPGRLGGEGALRGVRERQGLGLDKINILLQTSIGVLRIEGASLDPPYISILEPRKASDLNACYREGTVADKSMFSLSDLNSTGSIYPPEGLKLKKNENDGF